MLDRYSRPILSDIWTDHYRFSTFLRIEILVCEAYHQLGHIPEGSMKCIRNASFDIERIHAIEQDVKHDIIAFLTSVSESIGDHSRFLHMGLTSSDIIDTCLSVQITNSLKIIIDDLQEVLEVLKRLAHQYEDLVCIGRSHGIHAEPISMGVKISRYYAEMLRSMKRLVLAKEEVSICKISGSLGNFANVPPYVEEYVAEKLELATETVSSQVIPRDRHAFVFSVFAILASSIENIATEIRHLQKSEVMEVAEGFSELQKGSSSMPHKRNPILSENLTGLSRVIRSYVVPAYENITLWHERDISHSSVERFIVPSACVTMDFALNRLKSLLEGLNVNEKNINRNVQGSLGLVFSQKILLELIKVTGISRESAYKKIQIACSKVFEEGADFIEALNADPLIKESIQDWDKILDVDYYVKNNDYIFSKVFSES
ncbi:MAG: adenylosuccinate lyase [Candidatus Xenolissoclinum pacificiensis L6]|uniref:Adenylosuccinate lyase n=1 Tax=Candidatus Xenolissoclinum pacificiensis L6 TaxID=1401685 RepID=W2UZA7_9RICK|nr:MAG: adenylosuccinate lyase [Candidatus Xenolissoclinum pacificiensis L6]